jgi:hypothetical protein
MNYPKAPARPGVPLDAPVGLNRSTAAYNAFFRGHFLTTRSDPGPTAWFFLGPLILKL